MTPAPAGFSPETKNLLKQTLSLSRKRKVKLYLVGGILRDLILAREKENLDLDFTLAKGAVNFGRALSRELKAGFVILDKGRGACRVVKKIKDKVYTLDFTDFRGRDLKEDLLRRDFTINSLAMELDKAFAAAPFGNFLIDPCGAVKDLRSGIIRTAYKKSFTEDPLRILRAFSLAAIFGFRIDSQTLSLIRREKDKLAGVSGERIRDELFKILDCPDAFEYFILLDKMKILKIIFPEIEMMRGVRQGPYHHLDVWRHTLETFRQMEILIRELKNDRQVPDYLEEAVSPQRKRRSLIKLGALLHDIGKPKAKRRQGGKTKFHGHEKIGSDIAREIVGRLKLSNDELDSLRKMIFCHLRPGYLADNAQITARAIFRYFRDAGRESVSTLMISIADQRSTKGRLTSRATRRHHEKVALELIGEYFRRQKEKKPVRLLNGNELMQKFRLQPSPLIGKILSELEELQTIGRVKNKQEALAVARKLL